MARAAATAWSCVVAVGRREAVSPAAGKRSRKPVSVSPARNAS
jgi:hypothetical protein